MRRRGRFVARAAAGALVAAQVGYGRRPARTPPATRALLMLLLAASGAEAVQARGVRRGGGALASAGAIGFAAELLGVATGRPFGRYAYSAQLGPRIAGVPLLAPAAWAAMARPAWVAAGWASRRRVLRVPLAAAGLAAWDVYIEPRMVREGYWTWERRGRYEGVPATNFAGWFLTGLAVAGAASALDGDRPDARDDGALWLYAWTWAGEGIANAALWSRPRIAASGGAAMGAIAVPALAARSRA